ncbi:MAG: FAD-dependent oxidoreductase [Planctomycetaceae bacterium]
MTIGKPTDKLSTDVLILGAGFGGCLMALVLRQQGRNVVMLDRQSHPRFTIGESSTPLADLQLKALCQQYNLPQFLPFCQYGSWKKTHPDISCGLKRGFSYFRHEANEQFVPDEKHQNELFVTANSSDETADTHWFRADVDAYFAEEVHRAGIPLFESTVINSIESRQNEWTIRATQNEIPLEIHARFLIDASGSGRILQRTLAIPDLSNSLLTHSRVLYSHFQNVIPWNDQLHTLHANLTDHPFVCDDSALHHVFDNGWMWQLRFDNGITSAGFALNSQQSPLDETMEPLQEWRHLLESYPSIAGQFADAERALFPGRIIRSSRIQRLASQIAGPKWAMLPHTAGFVDPLHSTGIAHSLHGIAQLAAFLEEHWDGDQLAEQLVDYQRKLLAEFRMIDHLVASCYNALPCFPVFAACTMLYFAAATTAEQRQFSTENISSRDDNGFLLADDEEFFKIVAEFHRRTEQIRQSEPPSYKFAREFERDLARTIQPYNSVGLCKSELQNMYRYTAADK